MKAARLMVEGRKRYVHNNPCSVFQLTLSLRFSNARDTVDLHGLTLNEALTLSQEAANTWWARAGGGMVGCPVRTVVF